MAQTAIRFLVVKGTFARFCYVPVFNLIAIAVKHFLKRFPSQIAFGRAFSVGWTGNRVRRVGVGVLERGTVTVPSSVGISRLVPQHPLSSSWQDRRKGTLVGAYMAPVSSPKWDGATKSPAQNTTLRENEVDFRSFFGPFSWRHAGVL